MADASRRARRRRILAARSLRGWYVARRTAADDRFAVIFASGDVGDRMKP